MQVTRKIVRFESNDEFLKYDKEAESNGYHLTYLMRFYDGSIKAEYTATAIKEILDGIEPKEMEEVEE